MKVFTPASPIRLYDLLWIKTENEQLAIAKELFEFKTNYSDAKCEALYSILSNAVDKLSLSAMNVSDMLTGKSAFDFWPKIMNNSQMSLKEAAEEQGLTSVSKFNSCAHAIYVPVCRAFGGEVTVETPELREFKNLAEEPNAFILVGDSLPTIQKKIQKAFCPEGEDNGVLAQFKLVERVLGLVEVGFKKHTYDDLHTAYLSGEVGPKELKETLTTFYASYASSDSEFEKQCQDTWKMK